MLIEMTEKMEVSQVFTSLPEAPRADSDTQLLEIWLHGRPGICFWQLKLAHFGNLIWPTRG